MSRALTIAREDFRHVLRHRLVWGAVVLLGLMFLPSTRSIAASGHRTIGEFLLQMPLDLITYALVVVAAVGYNAVVGERAAGTVRFVLALPGTRRDFLFGKLLARSAVVVFALAVILAVANVFVALGYGRPYLASFWTMAGWMLLYAVVWTAVTVGYSAAFASQFRTLGALVVTYVAFSPDFGVWSVLVRPLFALVFTGSLDPPEYETLATAPLWVRATERLNPLTDFWHAMRWSVETVGPGTPTGGPLPHLLGTVVFLLFGAIPLGFGYRRFRCTDLGDDDDGPRWGVRLWRALHGAVPSVALGRVVTGPDAARVRTLAAEDLRHALQNWVVVGGVVVTLLLAGPQLWQTLDPASNYPLTEQLTDVQPTVVVPLLVLGIAVGYDAVVGERDAGTIRLTLGLPVTRRDVVLGKLLSRVGIVVSVLVLLIAYVEAVVVVRFGGFYPAVFLAWAGWMLAFGVVWTSVAVGLSAAVTSRYRALAGIFGTFLLFDTSVGLWGSLVRPLVGFVFTGHFSAGDLAHSADGGPVWFRYPDHLSPFVASGTVHDGLFTAVGYGAVHMDVAPLLFLYSVAVLVLFATIPVWLGYRRFAGSDLG